MKLRVRPCLVKGASLAFVRLTHRRLPKVQGAMWGVRCLAGDELVGIALVGWPGREWTNEELDTLCVLRVAVKGGEKGAPPLFPNACSMLYGACWRAARGMGVDSMVTYTHLDESGKSLVAAGWILDPELTRGGEWDTPTRPRQLVIDSERKRRWWAPGSKRAPA